MKLISIDPGGTVGYSIWHGRDRVEQGEMKPAEFLEYLEDTIGDYDMVLYETYKLRASSAKAMIGNDFETSQVIGVIKWICRKAGVKIETQSPAQKEFFSDDKLKKLDFYDRGERHSRDATRHALYYLFFTAKLIDLKELAEG